MEYSAHSLLAGWESFYVILGTSAGALTGLQFVVMALIKDSPTPSSPEAITAFGTPTVVHFCQALFVAGIVSAPWPHLTLLAIALFLSGVAGFGYAVLTWVRARRQPQYRPVTEDWIWHVILPLTAYAALTIAALAISNHEVLSLFIVAGVALLLVFIGIHNAWDTVEYITLHSRKPQSE
jgi:hypothetical protein